MYEYERIDQQLNDYYSFTSTIIHFLDKYLNQFYKGLITYSFILKSLHEKSTKLLNKKNSNSNLYQAFVSLTQTFNDEYHQLEQRAKFLKIIQITIGNLKQQINSSIIIRQKNKLHKYTFSIIRLNRKKKRQYLHQLIQQIQKHDKLTLIWKDNLDNITSQTTNLIWKLFSYSPFRFDIKSIRTSSSSINQVTVENDKQYEFGSGDQLHSKEIIPYELQQPISNSNNALMISENRSLYSTDIDEDNRRINIVKQKTILLVSTDQSSDDSESIINQNKIHLSDISYTTDYYSQNESD